MTSFQNVSESEIQGYNDCSLLVDYKTTPRSNKPYKRRHNLLNNSSTTSLNSISSNSSISSEVTPTLTPPKRTPSIAKIPEVNGSTESWVVVSQDQNEKDSLNQDIIDEYKQKELTKDILKIELKNLLNHTNNLNEKEFNHYSNKLTQVIEKDNLSLACKEIIFTSLKNFQSNKIETKDNLMKFILSNDGTSSWGLPLKKLIENTK
ncbi:hypothetical protein WICMUC_003028 [Wickerhamomyces mucosus]|uniref:Uncharacterized protein n=1 Tax=Wickerhamomyces mucosus TaxID=1378264 RepID=A0A9P8TDS3_9ASCO|nr:hypothetical protein WICMUC_003028 [Wickerhamomyces mucosus]